MSIKRIILTNYKKNLYSPKIDSINNSIENKAKYGRIFRKSNYKQNDSHSSISEIKIRKNQSNKDEILKRAIFSSMLNESNKIFNDINFEYLNVKLNEEQNQKRFKIINEIKLFLSVNKINFLLCDVIYLFDILISKCKKYDYTSSLFNYQNLGLGSLILTIKFHNVNENNTNINYKKYKSLFDEKYFSLNEFKSIELYSLKLLNYNLISPSQSSYMKFILNNFFNCNKNNLKFMEKILKEIMILSNEYMKYHPFYLACFIINYYFDKTELKNNFNKIIYYLEFNVSKYKISYQKFIDSNNVIIDNIFGDRKYSTINIEKPKNMIEKDKNIIKKKTIINENKRIKKLNNANEKILNKHKKILTISMPIKNDNNNNKNHERKNTCINLIKNHLLLKKHNQKIIHNNTENSNDQIKLKNILFNRKNNNNSSDLKNSINNSNLTNSNDNTTKNFFTLKKKKLFYLPNFPNINYYMKQREKYDNKNIRTIQNSIEEKKSKIKNENTKAEEKNSFSNYFDLSNKKLVEVNEKRKDKNKNDYAKLTIINSHNSKSIRKIYLKNYKNKNLVCKNLLNNNDILRNTMTIEDHRLVNSGDNIDQFSFNSPEKKNNIRKYYKSKKKENNHNRNNI